MGGCGAGGRLGLGGLPLQHPFTRTIIQNDLIQGNLWAMPLIACFLEFLGGNCCSTGKTIVSLFPPQKLQTDTALRVNFHLVGVIFTLWDKIYPF